MRVGTAYFLRQSAQYYGLSGRDMPRTPAPRRHLRREGQTGFGPSRLRSPITWVGQSSWGACEHWARGSKSRRPFMRCMRIALARSSSWPWPSAWRTWCMRKIACGWSKPDGRRPPSGGVKHGRPKKPQTIKTKLKDEMVNMRLGMVQMRTEMNECFGAMQIEFGDTAHGDERALEHSAGRDG
jgi:hypothetical protein